MIRYSRVLLLLSALALIVACGPSSGDVRDNADGFDVPALTLVDPSTRRQFALPGGRTLRFLAKTAVIEDSQGRRVAENRGLIRLEDEEENCPSEGLWAVGVDAEGFRIQQKTCSGWLFIDETLTFAPASGGGYVLEQVVLRYLDRRAPEADDVVRTLLTPADFGSVRFEEVVLDALYKLQE